MLGIGLCGHLGPVGGGETFGRARWDEVGPTWWSRFVSDEIGLEGLVHLGDINQLSPLHRLD